jgi:hypothetical protein
MFFCDFCNMKKIIGVFCVAILGAFQVKAQCNELFISEYVEGSRNNKALEIYNPTDKSVDLTGYRVTRWQNGSAAWTAQMSDLLSGSIQPKDVIVVVLDRRDTTQKGQDTPVVMPLRLKADLFLSKDYNTSYSMSFNGDDAMSIDKFNDATGKWVPVDIFGKIGERPSPAWSDKAPFTGTGTWYSLDKNVDSQRQCDEWCCKESFGVQSKNGVGVESPRYVRFFGFPSLFVCPRPKCVCEGTGDQSGGRIPQPSHYQRYGFLAV